ncbi:MAG: ChbG/HpnK family deacetylase [Verrucomicrobiota bacterium]
MKNLQIRFVADDLGWDRSANESIIHTHQHGVLTSAALMMGQPGTEEAIVLARQNPRLEVGLHFHFCDSIPLTTSQWPWGENPASLGFQLGFKTGSFDLILREIQAQWNAFKLTGLTPSFVNVHHHMHAHPWIAFQLNRFLKRERFHGWIRLGKPSFFSHGDQWKSTLISPLVAQYQKIFGLETPETLWGIDRPFQMNPEEVRQAIGTLTGGIHELIFHPRHLQDCDTLCLIQLKQLGFHS